MRAYELLISRLDHFIRKYYVNQLLRGGLVLLASLLTILLLVGVGEYFLYLSPAVKIPLLVVVGLFALTALIFWVAVPLVKMAHLGKTLSREDAAIIAGRHFPDVDDKMLNVLQLQSGAVSGSDSDLLLASIEQKASQLSVIPIARAIDLGKNKKYLPWLLPVLGILLLFLVLSPTAFRKTGERLLQPATAFEKPAPFDFVLLNGPVLTVPEGEDLTVRVRASGSALPEQMDVVTDANRQPMRTDSGVFVAKFEKVTTDIPFRLSASGYNSKPYVVRVLPKPSLLAVRVQLTYPAYTGRATEVRNSMGDLSLPVGTQVSWMLTTQSADHAQLYLGNTLAGTLPRNGRFFGASHRFLTDTMVTFAVQNTQSRITEKQTFRVAVLPDAPPAIQLTNYADSSTGGQILLTGTAGDDYGLSRLTFVAVLQDATGRVVANRSVNLPISGKKATSFQHYFDASALLGSNQRMRYWVEAWDNDGVHGPKVARSTEQYFDRTGGKKTDVFLAENAKQVSQGLSNSAKENQELQKATKDLQSQLLQSEETSWESKAAIQEMMDQQEDLKQKLETAKKRFEEGMKQRQNRDISEDAKEKTEALKEQMDRLLNKELAEQMQKLQELMQKLNKDKAVQTLQKLEQDNKLFNMDLQRLQELMKKLEQQLKLEDLAAKMESLAQKQGDLKDKTDQNARSNEELAQQQKDLQKELQEALKKDLKEAGQQATKAEEKELSKSEQSGKDANGAMQQSSEQLNQNQKQNASKSQQQAKEKLQEMAQALRSAASGASLEQINIDIRATRQILTNLMRLSFAEEGLVGKTKQTSPASPEYLANLSEQSRQYTASHIIRDSLYTLSKRIFQLSATVNKETAGLESSLSNATTSLNDRQIGPAAQAQQYAMTHTNNLALMLNELLSNLMQQQSQAMQQQGNSGSCTKPGGSKPSGKPGPGSGGAGQLQDIISGQQQLGNAMQQAAQTAARRQGGQKPGGQKPGGQQGQGGQSGQQGQDGQGGQKPGGQGGQQGSGGQGGSGNGGGQSGSEGENGDAEQLARFAEQQAAVRRQVQQLVSKLTGSGNPEAARMLREIAQQMDKNEEDLVNRRITPELATRQSQIFTRLLEADKAMREQEQDNKRASTAGVEMPRPIPAELQRILRQHQALLEGYRTVPADLKPFYKELVQRYYQNIGAAAQ
ncbi:MAG: DUF4175 family protein [Sphingobacteriales bacterium]|nr:MAG: DUF4175 family protein [Sphingobacteriales bacterium]